MKIMNISKIPIECFDGSKFVRILPGCEQEVDTAIVRRRKLIERGLVVSAEQVAQKPVAPAAAPVAPAYKSAPRAKLDEADA